MRSRQEYSRPGPGVATPASADGAEPDSGASESPPTNCTDLLSQHGALYGHVGVASLNRCKFAAALRFPGSSLGGCDLLVEGVAVELLVFDSVEVLAVDVGERRAV